jgi:signal peptidase I
LVFDFSFVLVMAALVTGLIWLLDARWLRPRRLQATGGAAGGPAEPILVEYARSFFPIIMLVMVIRSWGV